MIVLPFVFLLSYPSALILLTNAQVWPHEHGSPNWFNSKGVGRIKALCIFLWKQRKKNRFLFMEIPHSVLPN